MNYIVNLAFLAFALYTLVNGKYIFHLAVLNFLLRSLAHTFEFSLLVANLAGISIYTSDIYIIILLMRLLLVERRDILMVHKRELLVYVYSLFVLISIARGIYINGFNSELVGDIRKFGGFIMTLIYFSHQPFTIDEKCISFLRKVMRLIYVYCCICWISALLLGTYLTPNGSLRCMGSDYAFIFAMWTLYLLYEDIVVKPKHRISLETCLYIIGIVILQHNSVYAAFISGVFVILIFNYRETILKHPIWIIQAAIAIILIFAFIISNANTPLAQTLLATFDKFSQATSETSVGTIGTRYDVWAGLIATLNSAWEWLLGKPMGTGYHVIYMGSEWQASPHNGYIENLMRVGLIGIASLVIYIINLIVRYIKNEIALCAAVLIAILVYWYPYSMTVDIGLIIGMCMAYFNGNLSVEFGNEYDESEAIYID